jgi:chromatin segregation and condensation protein Rec8/ScpA/Scc1 (kleisin family)
VLTWDQIAGDSVDAAIATFLAVLELIRRAEIRVRQEHPFDPIVVEALPASDPRTSQP